MRRERIFCFDVIRAVAVVMVIAVHFFLHTGFYEIPLVGPTMALAAWLRMMLTPCVPLFLVLSGYFCAERRWSKRYLWGLLSVLAVYLLTAVLCLIFRGLWLKEKMEVAGVVRQLLNFSATPYGWYVEMYFGLYLLMPFLNAGWKALDKSHGNTLLVILLLLVSVPTLTNASFQIMPTWWLQLYPAAYYLLGVRLRDSWPRLERKGGAWFLLAWMLCAAAAAALRWAYAAGGTFSWAGYIDYNSPFVVVETLCAFALLRRCDGEVLPKWFRRGVSCVARLSLPIYLLSYIFDTLFYPILNDSVPLLKGRLLFLSIMAAAVLVCSTLVSWPLDRVAKALVRRLPTSKDTTSKGDMTDEH